MTAENASKNWELTLYELHRKPQEPITDGTVIAVSPRSLKSELMCPICLDILKVTMTTKECLHRFCSECIITALRSGNKECPTCRKKLVSKRSLRRDPNFDALIAKIYPTRQEYEAHQDKILARLNRQHLNAALTRSLEQQLGLDSSRSRNVINGRSDHVSGTGSAIAGSSLHDGNTDNAASEEDTPSTFGANDIPNSTRRISHVNSDTESGVETNSVGEASSISVSDVPSRNTVGSALGLMDHSTSNLLNNHVCPMDGSTIQGNVIHSTNSNMSPSIFPEIEILLKPHPRYIQRSVSPSASGSRTNSSVFDSGNGTGGLVKYVKAPTITTVDHLCRYLTVRVNLQRMHREVPDDNVNFVLYTYNEATNTFNCVDSHMSVEEISRTQCPNSQCLDLYYARGDTDDI